MEEGGIGELFVRTEQLRSSDETFAVPQPVFPRKSDLPEHSEPLLFQGDCPSQRAEDLFDHAGIDHFLS
ncbi:MAG: hypothetical protein WCO99_14940, partial [Planctomycetota bacterium]